MVGFEDARNDIFRFLDSLSQRVFKRSDFDQILSENHDSWELAPVNTSDFLSFLQETGKLTVRRLKFPHRTETRFAWGNASDLEIVQTLRPGSYFTHFTAMFLHGLTLQIPKTIYLNYEQPKKRQQPDGDVLAQERIDYAFRAPCRVSKTVAELGDKRVCLLNGKFTARTGVIDLADGSGALLQVTDVERTLIDATVRPVYSGGVYNVLEAYRNAKDKVSINRLAAILTNLGYIYPYHQAIGFYIERAGNYSERQIELLRRFDMKYDFYLTHQIKDKEYSERWRLFYPKGL